MEACRATCRFSVVHVVRLVLERYCFTQTSCGHGAAPKAVDDLRVTSRLLASFVLGDPGPGGKKGRREKKGVGRNVWSVGQRVVVVLILHTVIKNYLITLGKGRAEQSSPSLLLSSRSAVIGRRIWAITSRRPESTSIRVQGDHINPSLSDRSQGRGKSLREIRL